MNFETKYLIRWGVPGWIMVMILLPYFLVINFKDLSDHVSSSSDLLAVGAVLTVLGVPLGYLLNQIHHSVTWVLPKYFLPEVFESWDEYFKNELLMDEYFMENKTKGEAMKNRYSYLLSRKHELGGITASLLISTIVIWIGNALIDDIKLWHWIYFIIILVLSITILFSRQYSSKNIYKYYEYILDQQKQK
ncbi:hypothetical protein SAMN05428981_102470 [Bacillus sp. OV194]|nr:hypothetical protein SAMN05428981_102470 [Bacillus sp. OV194]